MCAHLPRRETDERDSRIVKRTRYGQATYQIQDDEGMMR